MHNEAQPILPKLIDVFKDGRGDIKKPNFINDLSFNDTLFITCTPQSVRARHYHKLDYHLCLLTKGSMFYYERPVGVTDKPIRLFLKTGDIFFTNPMVEHEMEFLEYSEFWCFSHLSRKQEDYEKDTVRLQYSLKDIYDAKNL